MKHLNTKILLWSALPVVVGAFTIANINKPTPVAVAQKPAQSQISDDKNSAQGASSQVPGFPVNDQLTTSSTQTYPTASPTSMPETHLTMANSQPLVSQDALIATQIDTSQATNQPSSDKYDGDCPAHPTTGRCADKCADPTDILVGYDPMTDAAICRVGV